MLTQRDTLRRLAGTPGVFMSGAVHDVAARPMRLVRQIVSFDDGTTVKLAYDETLELSALIKSGPSPVIAVIWSHATPETKHTLDVGAGDQEIALPSTSAARVKARRVGQNCPRWDGIAIQIQRG